MIEYIIEATVGKGKIDYKYFVKFQLETPGVIDANKILWENDEFTNNGKLKSLEERIGKLLQNHIEKEDNKKITFEVTKREQVYNLKLIELK